MSYLKTLEANLHFILEKNMRQFKTGQKVYLGYDRKYFKYDKINAVGFYKKGTVGHPVPGEISTLPYRCCDFSCYGWSRCCKNDTGYTYAKVILERDCNNYCIIPKLVCLIKHVEIKNMNLFFLTNPRFETYFKIYKEFNYRQGPVPHTGYGNKISHTRFSRHSVFGSYRMAEKFSFDYIDDDTIVKFNNARQKKAYFGCGMNYWERSWSRRSKNSWKRCKNAQKSWMKHF